MVLAELGSKLAGALKRVTQATKIDREFLTEILNDIVAALLSADVNFMQVARLKQNVETKVLIELKDDKAFSANARKLIEKTVVYELIEILNADKEPYEFKRGKQ
jgi:signal recognition particle subunit SRP54